MLNRCEFIGNVGRDPEIRTFQSGDKVANLSLAVSEKWKDKSTGERREKTTWVPVAVFGPLANVVEQYVSKGSKLYVAGQFETRKWQDQSGADRYMTEIVLRGYGAALVMLDSASGGGRSGGDSGGRDDGYGSPKGGDDGGYGGVGGGPDLDDEIPFGPEWRA